MGGIPTMITVLIILSITVLFLIGSLIFAGSLIYGLLIQNSKYEYLIKRLLKKISISLSGENDNN